MDPKTRHEILRKYNFTCQQCGAKPPDAKLHIDHKIPKSKGNRYNDSELLFFLTFNDDGKTKYQLSCSKKDFEKDPASVFVTYYSYLDGRSSWNEFLDFTKIGRFEMFEEPKAWRARQCEIWWHTIPEMRESNRSLKELIETNERLAAAGFLAGVSHE